MSGDTGPARRVACPRCGTPADYSSANPSRPFCSERCRQIDLGAWATESYRIPVREDTPEEPPDAGEETARPGD